MTPVSFKMPVPPEPKVLHTPIPVPIFFNEEKTFSLKKRAPANGLSSVANGLCQSLPPRPPSKGGAPVSRMFLNREYSWSHPRPRGVSFRESAEQNLSFSHYDESKKESYFQQCFRCICILGRGSFGEVYKVRSLEDGQLYAVKCSMERFRGVGDRQQKLQEVLKHERLPPHPNCVTFKKAWEEKGRLYIQTELCQGSLQQLLPSSEGEVWDILSDLLCALRHLHSHNMLHLDIKPANVFLSTSGRCKLGDFGLVLDLGDKKNGQEGDPRYMAPELLQGKFTPAADVFSLGMTILELACNIELPKGGDAWQQIRQGYLPPEITSGLSPMMLNILKMMLHPNPSKRATVFQLCSLPFIRRIVWKRNLSLKLKESLRSMQAAIQWIMSLVCRSWFSLIPLPPRWKLKQPETPTRSESSSSYSDIQQDSLKDEVFHLPLPQLDVSPIILRSGCHSPAVPSRLSLGSTSTPQHLYREIDHNHIDRSGDCGPDMSWISGSSESTSPVRTPSCSSSSSPMGDDLNHKGQRRPGFEPKNLLSLFEEASMEE
ncbi:membrane-associated tyrosine- and threonine-specific cdc2-inhibitory kinase [Polypterus senegalus]|uniref:membrane-associated tyrosine- and threonine-specific cdc2-inhibitory kinase n=1 Tax=Polypterus senegalus TaxID=55291 RepID=UPI0019657174|nr:membrane-associated tyrosine- and threonine-specific cdc2-inhibitory kinase [Polypterus senegalus]